MKRKIELEVTYILLNMVLCLTFRKIMFISTNKINVQNIDLK